MPRLIKENGSGLVMKALLESARVNESVTEEEIIRIHKDIESAQSFEELEDIIQNISDGVLEDVASIQLNQCISMDEDLESSKGMIIDAIEDEAEYDELEESDNNEMLFYGVPEVKIIDHGEWASPEIEYKGNIYDYYDLEDSIYNAYEEYCNENNIKFNKEEFKKWVLENKDYVYSDLENLTPIEGLEESNENNKSFKGTKKEIVTKHPELKNKMSSYADDDEMAVDYNDDGTVKGFRLVTTGLDEDNSNAPQVLNEDESLVGDIAEYVADYFEYENRDNGDDLNSLKDQINDDKANNYKATKEFFEQIIEDREGTDEQVVKAKELLDRVNKLSEGVFDDFKKDVNSTLESRRFKKVMKDVASDIADYKSNKMNASEVYDDIKDAIEFHTLGDMQKTMLELLNNTQMDVTDEPNFDEFYNKLKNLEPKGLEEVVEMPSEEEFVKDDEAIKNDKKKQLDDKLNSLQDALNGSTDDSEKASIQKEIDEINNALQSLEESINESFSKRENEDMLRQMKKCALNLNLDANDRKTVVGIADRYLKDMSLLESTIIIDTTANTTHVEGTDAVVEVSDTGVNVSDGNKTITKDSSGVTVAENGVSTGEELPVEPNETVEDEHNETEETQEIENGEEPIEESEQDNNSSYIKFYDEVKDIYNKDGLPIDDSKIKNMYNELLVKGTVLCNGYQFNKEDFLDGEPIEESENMYEDAKVSKYNMIKNQGPVFMLQVEGNSDFEYIVGEHWNPETLEIDNADTFSDKDSADKEYFDRVGVNPEPTQEDK